jgi:hypothetical protein
MKEINLQDTIATALNALQEERNRIIQEAVDHYQVPTEQLPDRVYMAVTPDDTTLLFVDKNVAVTFYPYNFGLDGKINFKYVEHYKNS